VFDKISVLLDDLDEQPFTYIEDKSLEDEFVKSAKNSYIHQKSIENESVFSFIEDDPPKKKQKHGIPGNLHEEGWITTLESEFQKQYFQDLIKTLEERRRKEVVFPDEEHIFAAFNECPFEKIKVVIIGQVLMSFCKVILILGPISRWKCYGIMLLCSKRKKD
jgi:hypothetical protein